jgi:hypothetical protein
MTQEEAIVEIDLSKVLGSILAHHKEISVPTEIFMNETGKDRQLEIIYDDETKSFIFKLGEEIGNTTDAN